MNIEKIKEQCFLDTEDPGQIEIGQRCVPRRGQQLSCVTGGDYHEADSASCEPCTSNPPTRVPRSGTPVPQSVTSGTIIGPKESFTAFSGGLSPAELRAALQSKVRYSLRWRMGICRAKFYYRDMVCFAYCIV